MDIIVKVITKAKAEKIKKISSSEYKVWLSEMPEKGRANKRLISLLAEYFNAPKSSMVIVRGQKSSLKVIHKRS